MATNDTIGYKDVNPFYHHIHWLLENEATTKWKYNDIKPMGGDPLTQQLIHLEDWYMTLETLYDRIIGKLLEDEVKAIDSLFKVVEDKTKGDNFTTPSLLGTEDIIAIRTTCRKLSRELNLLLWKHKIHVDVKTNKEYASHGDEIDEENAL